MSSQSAPEYTATIPRGNTYVASDILQMLDCSGNICGCHLLHSLCNHPFDKPLHPPKPSALPPSSPSSGEWKGDQSNHIYVTLDPFSVRVVAHPVFPTQLRKQGERCKPPSVRPTVVQLPLYDLRFASVDKGSDAYQTLYRDAS